MLKGVVIDDTESVQRPAPGVGGLLQLQPSARSLSRTPRERVGQRTFRTRSARNLGPDRIGRTPASRAELEARPGAVHPSRGMVAAGQGTTPQPGSRTPSANTS